MTRVVLDTNWLIALELVTPYYRFDMIKADRDDNKFVDCAIAANATYIVSDDKHFKPLRHIGFPKLAVLKLMEFVEKLEMSAA